jgi:hypothetical protein
LAWEKQLFQNFGVRKPTLPELWREENTSCKIVAWEKQLLQIFGVGENAVSNLFGVRTNTSSKTLAWGKQLLQNFGTRKTI